MQDQSKMENAPRQNCPLLKLSTELRLEICRVAIQHDLGGIKSTPNSFNPTFRPLLGALALPHNCRTLRAESIDAMGSLAQASKTALQTEIALAESEMNSIATYSGGFMFGNGGQESRFANLIRVLISWGSSLNKIRQVCSLLDSAHDADRKGMAG